ncbi:AIPR family protein [uncultured Sphingobacterium sp.]|uniref:AIPR family protein n=1 Tax=uncultured Sphingobacterium sp. TaxID=182688 RepID=UPI0025F2810E|nr:AIPR family protein [uncultured Sphingobacterium sp.]
MISLDDFHQYFTQSVLADAESRGLMKAQSFFESVCEDLVTIGDLTNNYTYAEYSKKGIEVYGYDYDEERKILTILNHHYFQENTIQTVTRNQIDVKFARMKTFFQKSTQGFHNQLEETSEAYAMAYHLMNYHQKDKIDRVRIMLLTDGKTTRSLRELPSQNIDGIIFDYRIIDIEYLHKIYSSQQESGEFEVHADIPFLKVNSENDSYQSYLSVLNGSLLVEIYERFGQKLFEQNVRTFLQFRGAVNRGLKNTIEFKPEMFFAYNNGITATASSLEIGENGNINLIKNFQIVNGGQTTSAIYAAHKNSKLDVSKVSVQMKLSVVNEDGKQDDFVSKVAEYANTQNKINNSDFFSNSPFHKDMKEYSVRIFAPAKGGEQRRTHWFYERVRGEYLNSQAYLGGEAKSKFLLENPKNQLVDKTLLAKAENSWNQFPNIVAKGAQDSFRKFADSINGLLEKDNLSITETYFKESIAKVILFRKVERLVTQASWYDGGFRAQTVTYTIAYLAALIENSNLNLNFNRIWEDQDVAEALINLIETIAEKVYFQITNPPAGYANVSQWTKNIKCWEQVQDIDIDFPELDESLFMEQAEKKYIAKDDKNNKKIDSGINLQIQVMSMKTDYWKKLSNYYFEYRSSIKLSSMQQDMLQKMARGSISYPSEKQSKILFYLMETAKKEGLDF